MPEQGCYGLRRKKEVRRCCKALSTCTRGSSRCSSERTLFSNVANQTHLHFFNSVSRSFAPAPFVVSATLAQNIPNLICVSFLQ